MLIAGGSSSSAIANRGALTLGANTLPSWTGWNYGSACIFSHFYCILYL